MPPIAWQEELKWFKYKDAERAWYWVPDDPFKRQKAMYIRMLLLGVSPYLLVFGFGGSAVELMTDPRTAIFRKIWVSFCSSKLNKLPIMIAS